jgi:hypothetical protein
MSARARLAGIAAVATAAITVGCSGGCSSGASSAAPAGGTRQLGGAAGGGTTAGATSATIQPQSPQGLQRGDVRVDYALQGTGPADLAVSWSWDFGQTWNPATEAASGSDGKSALAPGQHKFVWASGTDLAGNAAPDVRLRLAPSTGAPADTADFPVDDTPAVAGIQLARAPYVQAVDATSAIVAWRTAEACATILEYGATQPLGGLAGDLTATKIHVVKLTGLRPATTYSYRVDGGGASLSQVAAFHTAPAPGSAANVSFLVFGDCGTGDSVQADVAAMMHQEQGIDFAILTGDIVYDSGLESEYDPHFFAPYKDLMKSIPFFPSPGNHDYYWSTSANSVGPTPYLQNFYLPGNGAGAGPQGTYYSFDWGPAHFASLDVINSHADVGQPENQWVDADLAASGALWKFAYFHYPMYSSGQHGSDTSVRAALGPIFDARHVDVVFMGHDHDYERSKRITNGAPDPNGVQYIVTGGGGAGLYNVIGAWFTQVMSKNHHYCRVDISGRTLHVHVNGRQLATAIDDFTISK